VQRGERVDDATDVNARGAGGDNGRPPQTAAAPATPPARIASIE
jgi:hypothetical protein